MEELHIERLSKNATKDKNKHLYYLCFEMGDYDTTSAEKLGIEFTIYENILKKYGAEILNDRMYYFKTRFAANECLNSEDLLPYIAMAKLLE